MSTESATSGDKNAKKRRRRRRRRKGAPAPGAPPARAESGPSVSTPSTSRNLRRRRKRRRRNAPVAGLNRRRRLTRSEMSDLEEYFSKMPSPLLNALYKGLGGQPGRVTDRKRVVQLAVRAIAQGKRLGGLLKGMHERERTALALLIQCGGLAHSEEFMRELSLSLGGHEREWTKVMVNLADRGLVCASEEQDGVFFYLVPDPLVEHLLEHLEPDLAVPTFKHDDIRVRDPKPFCPPLDFSITTLCTYIDQRPPRLTQQHEIFKVHQEELDKFFAQVWEPKSELFHFHLDFLMGQGLVELRGDRLAVNREVVKEWLNLDPQDQRDLFFRALEGRFPYAEWILWAVHSGQGEWVPERPLQALYRRWKRGEDWRERFHKSEYAATRSHERESWSFAPLVNTGMLELGEWGQEKFYRLTPRALAMIEPPENEGFTQFYLTPSFEIMAPAGLAPILLFDIGELAELTGCDRANTYKITEITIEQALDKGWRRDDVLDFLRENSQIGLPGNVDQTLRGWMGQAAEVEFHDLVLMTVHKSRVRRLESNRDLKPYLLHRFVPGMYAVDRTKLPELITLLEEAEIPPGKEIRAYPGDPEQTANRDRLHLLVAEAREASEDPLARAHAADTQPEDLHPVPGSGAGRRRARKKTTTEAPRVTPAQAKATIDQAIMLRKSIEISYRKKDGSSSEYTVLPSRLALNPLGEQVVVAKNVESGELRTFKVGAIERVKVV
ncbi:MAG: helicase-associated domain-containing protein [Alphaproteobacteria bacterium]|nr:helicase-associated domain-containing protein [Alphaproteobacteria bacterium]